MNEEEKPRGTKKDIIGKIILVLVIVAVSLYIANELGIDISGVGKYISIFSARKLSSTFYWDDRDIEVNWIWLRTKTKIHENGEPQKTLCIVSSTISHTKKHTTENL